MPGNFEPLPLRRRAPKQGDARRYRVYKTPGEYVVVAAETVQQALEQSGVTNAYKVDLDSIDSSNVLEEQELIDPPDEKVASTENVATAENTETKPA